LVTVTFALGTEAPDGSLTVPVMVDRSDWDQAENTLSRNRHNPALHGVKKREYLMTPLL